MFKYLRYISETTSFGTTVAVFVSTAVYGVKLSSSRLASVDGNLDERQTIVAWNLLRRCQDGNCLDSGILIRAEKPSLSHDL